jgi:hypothetical protein
MLDKHETLAEQAIALGVARDKMVTAFTKELEPIFLRCMKVLDAILGIEREDGEYHV